MPLTSWQVAKNILGEDVITPDDLGNFSYPSSFLNDEWTLGADKLRRLRGGGSGSSGSIFDRGYASEVARVFLSA